jgi:transcription elongation factor Elf1
MPEFFCKTCNKYKPNAEKVMVKKTNGVSQAKCRSCVSKTMQPTPLMHIKLNHSNSGIGEQIKKAVRL